MLTPQKIHRALRADLQKGDLRIWITFSKLHLVNQSISSTAKVLVHSEVSKLVNDCHFFFRGTGWSLTLLWAVWYWAGCLQPHSIFRYMQLGYIQRNPDMVDITLYFSRRSKATVSTWLDRPEMMSDSPCVRGNCSTPEIGGIRLTSNPKPKGSPFSETGPYISFATI